MTYLLLDEAASITSGALEMAVNGGRWNAILNVRSSAGPTLEEAPAGMPASFVVAADGDPISVLFVEQPLPRKIWEACVAHDRVWADAGQAAAGGGAHVIIAGLAPKSSHEDVFDQALAVTVVAAAVATYLPVTAAIFADSGRIVPRQALIEAADGLAERTVPTEWWTDIQFIGNEKHGRRRTGAFTRGLLPFAGREIELQPSALGLVDVAGRMLGLSEYLITNGAVIGDGETVGLNADERIKARHRRRGRWVAEPVLELSL